jgi:hypothetical protein
VSGQAARRGGFSALLSTAGMEVCRLYALVLVFFLIPGSPPFPFAALACALAAGTLTGRALSFVARRRITGVLVYGALCLLWVFLLARPYRGFPFWLTACAAGLFWFRGVRIGGRGVSHSLTVGRYDIGIGVFLAVYFLRMGLREADPFAPRLLGAYFLFSILALGASRAWERDESFISSRGAFGLLVPFAAVFFFAASALVLLYPFFVRAAGDTYIFLRDNSGWLQDILVALVRFFFGFGRRARFEAASSPEEGGGDFVPVEGPSGSGLPEKILLWVFIVLGAALLIVLVAVFVFLLARYLAGREGPSGGPGFFAAFQKLLVLVRKKLRTALDSIRRAVWKITARRRAPAGAGQEAFRRLCAWGGVSGLPRRGSETPGEYAKRLAARFPSVQKAAGDVSRALEEELYGKKPLPPDGRARLREARKNLANPALVPARLLCRLGIGRKEK